MSARPHLLVICQDRLGPAMAGPAIRAFELASRLADRWNVTLLALQAPTEGWAPPEGVHLVVRDPLTWRGLRQLAATNDVVLAQPLRMQLQHAIYASGTPLVVDAYVPNMLEQATARGRSVDERSRELTLDRARIELQAAARIGSAFLCAGSTYRDFLLGVLGAEGRLDRELLSSDPTALNLVVEAPYGISEVPAGSRTSAGPLRAELELGPDDIIFIWAGGIWDWLDPLTPLRGYAKALASASADDPIQRSRFVFMGVDHPNPEVRTESLGKITRLTAELGIEDHVLIRRGWIPYAERGEWLVDADVGVCAHLDSLETRYAWRQRLLDHAWAGLPTICGAGDELGNLLTAYNAGMQIEAEDVDGWARSLVVACDATWRAQASAETAQVRSALSWSVIADSVHGALDRARIAASPGRSSPRNLIAPYVKVQAKRMGVATAAKKALRSVSRRR